MVIEAKQPAAGARKCLIYRCFWLPGLGSHSQRKPLSHQEHSQCGGAGLPHDLPQPHRGHPVLSWTPGLGVEPTARASS